MVSMPYADIEAECQDDYMKIRVGFNGSFSGLLYSAGKSSSSSSTTTTQCNYAPICMGSMCVRDPTLEAL